MKRYSLIIIALGIILCALFGCKKSEFMTYSSGQYLQFVNPLEDSLEFTFMFYPGISEYQISLPIEISGIPLSNDAAYKIVVDEKRSTAKDGIHFTLSDNQIFKAGGVTDACSLNLFRTPEMKTQDFRIVLRIEKNENFETGQLNHLYAIIHVSDKIARPAWWTTNPIEWYYLGEYSDKKYQLFMDVTGIADLTGYSNSEIRALTMLFTNYLLKERAENREVFEANGTTPMTTEFM